MTAACAQLTKGEQQPVSRYGSDTYYTTCSGIAEDWGTCHKKAMKTCAQGYSIVEKTQDSSGVHRTLIFSCDK